MENKPQRWVMDRAGEPLKAADGGPQELGPDEVLVEIDACSLWRRSVGFAFGEVRGGSEPEAEMLHRISGHVVETGEDALFFADRPVVMSGVVPCGQHHACWTGGATTCPNKPPPSPNRDPASGNCVVAHTRDLTTAEKHRPHPLGPGLAPFEDG